MNRICIDESPILNLAIAFGTQTKEVSHLVIENHFNQNILGNIFLGKVVQHAPDIDGVFVDIGTPQNAFLPRKELTRKLDKASRSLPLSKLINKNQMIIVQVSKESYQLKGPQLTTDFAMAGKYVVILPNARGIKFSRKLTDSVPRAEIQKKIEAIDVNHYGWIVRSIVNEIKDLEMIFEDVIRMTRLWNDALKVSQLSSKIVCLYESNGFEETLYRELSYIPSESTHVISKERKDSLVTLGFKKSEIKVESSKNALYHEMGININGELFEQIFKSSEGFTYTIDELEAFTIVDVNSGQYRASSKKSMVSEVNEKAALEIKKKLLLRNISGVILIDFIDMQSIDQNLFLNWLHEEVFTKDDHFSVLGFTKLGLLEMTRKREKPSLLDALSFDFRKRDLLYWSLNEIYYELHRLTSHTNTKVIQLEVHPALYVFLTQNKIFEGFDLKIKLVKNQSKSSVYKINSNLV